MEKKYKIFSGQKCGAGKTSRKTQTHFQTRQGTNTHVIQIQ